MNGISFLIGNLSFNDRLKLQFSQPAALKHEIAIFFSLFTFIGPHDHVLPCMV